MCYIQLIKQVAESSRPQAPTKTQQSTRSLDFDWRSSVNTARHALPGYCSNVVQFTRQCHWFVAAQSSPVSSLVATQASVIEGRALVLHSGLWRQPGDSSALCEAVRQACLLTGFMLEQLSTVRQGEAAIGMLPCGPTYSRDTRASWSTWTPAVEDEPVSEATMLEVTMYLPVE